MERKLGLDEGTLLETPWEELDPELKKLWLYGTGDEHITFTWRSGASGHEIRRHVSKGIVPELLDELSHQQERDAAVGSSKST